MDKLYNDSFELASIYIRNMFMGIEVLGHDLTQIYFVYDRAVRPRVRDEDQLVHNNRDMRILGLPESPVGT